MTSEPTQSTVEQEVRSKRAEIYHSMLEGACEQAQGNRAWRDWKRASAAEFVKLATSCDRMRLLGIDLGGDFRAAYALLMPVARPPVDGHLTMGDEVVFDLMYQDAWRYESPPCFLPVGILHPSDVFHPNVRPAGTLPGSGAPPLAFIPRALVCLGNLPPNTSIKELVYAGYFALSMQDLMLDELDPNGVFNPQACEYYRAHPEYLPLTRAGLLDPWTPVT